MADFDTRKYFFIFQTSKHYELLNYSEHGTTVDNVLYSCDFSDKPATTPQPSAVVAAVRHLNKTHKPKMKADERLTLMARPHDVSVNLMTVFRNTVKLRYLDHLRGLKNLS